MTESFGDNKAEIIGLIAKMDVLNNVPNLVPIKALNLETPCNTSTYGMVELADKPGLVVDSYSSRPAIAHRLKRPTRFQREPRINY